MADIWLISDTHFNHANILNFKDKDGNLIRKFHDVHDMNETMIDRWNKLIRPQDKVYHLGDVYFGSQERAKEILFRLNGHKRLIVGNHDVIYGKGNPLQEFFKKIYMWRMMPEHGILMSHVPVHPSTLGEKRFGKEMWNIHGHTHQNGSPEGKYISVCVELRDYMPVHIEQIKKEISERT